MTTCTVPCNLGTGAACTGRAQSTNQPSHVCKLLQPVKHNGTRVCGGTNCLGLLCPASPLPLLRCCGCLWMSLSPSWCLVRCCCPPSPPRTWHWTNSRSWACSSTGWWWCSTPPTHLQKQQEDSAASDKRWWGGGGGGTGAVVSLLCLCECDSLCSCVHIAVSCTGRTAPGQACTVYGVVLLMLYILGCGHLLRHGICTTSRCAAHHTVCCDSMLRAGARPQETIQTYRQYWVFFCSYHHLVKLAD